MSEAVTLSANKLPRAKSVVKHFTFRRIRRGAILFGAFAAMESLAQAFGIVAAYPHAAERVKAITALSQNSALGMFYGDPHANITSPDGYMVYRVLSFLGLIGAIWGLVFMTGMLRGQEENGRWEMFLTGPTTARRASLQTLLGAGLGLLLSYAISVVVVGAAGASPKLSFSFGQTLFYGLALIASAATFVAVGAVTSQFAATRRRAALYGAGILAVFYLLRSVGNVVDSLAWLKNLTPFGWIDKLHPYTSPSPIWLLPIIAFIVACAIWALALADERDLGDSIIPDTDSALPRLKLLHNQLGFSFRLTRTVLAAWLIGCMFLAGLMAGIAKTAAKSITEAGSLAHTIDKLSGNAEAKLAVAFLSVSGYFISTLLMVMVVNGVGSLRNEEAEGRLDNFLAAAVARTTWLGSRLTMLVAGAITICLASSLTVWGIAAAQHITVDASLLVFGGLNVLAPVGLLLGFGVLVYGVYPRVGTALMYAWIAWSFTLDIIASITTISRYITDTSLFHYITFVPASNPNWHNFVVVTGIGLVLALIGVLAFSRRDLQSE